MEQPWDERRANERERRGYNGRGDHGPAYDRRGTRPASDVIGTDDRSGYENRGYDRHGDERRTYEHRSRRSAASGIDQNGRPLGEMFRELAVQTQSLVHLEVQLAKTEIAEKLSEAGKHGGLAAGGGMVAYAGLIGIVMALGFLLGSFMPNWIGFLIAGALFAAIGLIVLKKGIDGLQETQFSLEKTAESIEEDKEWIRGETSDVKKDPAHLGSHR